MKVTLDRQVFIKELGIVQRAISSKTTIPVLTGLLIEVSEKGMILTGSDANITIERTISAEKLVIKETGTVVVQSKLFGEIIKKLPEDTLTLTAGKDNVVKIKSGRSNYKVNGLAGDIYPSLPETKEDKYLDIKMKDLKRLVDSTVFSTSNQESRPILTGVHLVSQNGKLLGVATDSHRLSSRVIATEGEGKDFDVVVPAKALIDLTRSVTDPEEEMQLVFMDNQLLIKTKVMNFYTRLLEGVYPETSRLFPTKFSTEIEVSAREFLSTIERVALVTQQGRNNIAELSIEKGKVLLRGSSPEIGKVEEVVDCEGFEGEELAISFNPLFIKAALSAFGDTDVKIKFTSAVRPFVLIPSKTENDEEFSQLITPVRTN